MTGPFPAPFSVAPRWRVACCDVEGYEGFCVEARSNLTLAERDALVAGWDEAIAYARAWLAAPEAERDAVDTPHRRWAALLAPFVRAWNATGVDDATGEERPIPPPAEAGPAAFGAIEPPMWEWIFEAVGRGYVEGKGLTRSRPMSAPTSAPAPATTPETG